MSKKRRQFDRAFKVEAVRLVTEEHRPVAAVAQKGFEPSISRFLTRTGFYLRGRCDGPNRTGTDPCGYIFASEDSFDKGHDALIYFDPMPHNTPLKLSFRLWKGVLPFDREKWQALDGQDRLQKNMRVLELTSQMKIEQAIDLATQTLITFHQHFDFSIDLRQSRP